MLLSRFLQNSEGGVAMMAALATIPVFASVGAAVDLSRAASMRSAMQAAVDASVLAMAKDAKNAAATQLSENATNFFKANFQNPEVGNLQFQVGASATSSGYAVNMSVKGSVKTKLMGVVGFSTLDVAVRSAAVSIMDGLGCVLALNPQTSAAINGPGSTSVTLNGCSLYDNSNHDTALTVGGSAQFTALSVGVVGNLTGASNITTTNGIRTGIGAVADPYRYDHFPPFGGCTEHNLIAHGTITIEPGVYCGGMIINAGADVTLNPGTYYIDGGKLTINGGATVLGNGVTLVFTSQNRNGYATASISGGATINLTPPKIGPTAGIVMFGDRGMPTGAAFKLNGGATQYLGGAIYLPKAAVDFAGGSSTSASCTQLIANTIAFTGNSKLLLDCNYYGTKPFSAVVVRLSS